MVATYPSPSPHPCQMKLSSATNGSRCFDPPAALSVRPSFTQPRAPTACPRAPMNPHLPLSARLRTPRTTRAYARAVMTPSLRPVTTRDDTQSGFRILVDNIFSKKKSRSHTSVFTADEAAIHHLMSLHGLSADGANIRDCRKVLINHLLSGSCMDFDTHSNALPRPQRVACRNISHGFNSTSTLSV
ncbi:hypothetical protein C8F01DRAFT_1178536 [Mycena amicta]|nr:hypothetical protein C8F01DRAFT_1178536 [Mycena amicta]